jgi:MOB kinase activator 1
MMTSFLAYWSPRTKPSPPAPKLARSDSTSTVTVKLEPVGEEDPFIEIPEPAYVPSASGSYSSSTSNQRTRNQFRPRHATKGTTSYQLRQYAEATLGGGSLRKVVKLPEGEDENEWLAVNSMFKWICLDWRHELTFYSGGFLQSYQLAIRFDHRILFSAVMSRNEGDR